jgi:hypothetical protein
MKKGIKSGSLIIGFVLAFVTLAQAQNINSGSNLFRKANGIFRVAEAGQLADSVNVWGDIPNTGRFLIPKGTKLPELMSYAGGPRGLGSDIFNLSNVKINVNISRYMGPEAGASEISNFEFKYKEPIPAELYRYNLQNNDVVSIEVRRRPNFIDYIKVVGPIITTFTSILVLSRRL